MTNESTNETTELTFTDAFRVAWDEEVTGTDASPYVFAKVLSGLTGREIRPQMMYNYAKKGYLPTSVNSTGKMTVQFDQGCEFANRFVNRNGQIEYITNLTTAE